MDFFFSFLPFLFLCLWHNGVEKLALTNLLKTEEVVHKRERREDQEVKQKDSPGDLSVST